jgi:hypothetical protein
VSSLMSSLMPSLMPSLRYQYRITPPYIYNPSSFNTTNPHQTSPPIPSYYDFDMAIKSKKRLTLLKTFEQVLRPVLPWDLLDFLDYKGIDLVNRWVRIRNTDTGSGGDDGTEDAPAGDDDNLFTFTLQHPFGISSGNDDLSVEEVDDYIAKFSSEKQPQEQKKQEQHQHQKHQQHYDYTHLIIRRRRSNTKCSDACERFKVSFEGGDCEDYDLISQYLRPSATG